MYMKNGAEETHVWVCSKKLQHVWVGQRCR